MTRRYYLQVPIYPNAYEDPQAISFPGNDHIFEKLLERRFDNISVHYWEILYN
ncbi:hypothetical protein [Halobacillus sp. Marseille-P3879]|uniref:hypothetical protein n=1 Tax=Halobacillus sp. Marseille-P3879 TaxID=2045014 RepID=UPI001357B26F|nr:hypothetical protein [Halobacillus sp. Marseille-P3879]